MATIVFVHAHPDDEAILTAGTMKALVLAGHRVVLMLATDGAAGLTSSALSPGLGDQRLREADAAAAALGVSDRLWLGYGDSGLDGNASIDPSSQTLCSVDVSVAAERLATALREHHADIVVGYDRNGGYGHPDHKRVHQIVHTAADLANIPTVFEATLSREVIIRTIAPIAALGALLNISAITNISRGFSTLSEISHRVDVSLFLDSKRAAMQAHASQTVGGGVPRTLQVFLGLPKWLFTRLLGTEFYIQTRGDHHENAIARLAQTSVLK